MNGYTENERVIDLKDLLYRTARLWRKILVGALIVALLAALYQALPGLRVMLDNEKLAAAQETYEAALADHRADGEQLRADLAELRDQSERQREYNNRSELMKIDPMNKWVGSFQLYIDAAYPSDTAPTARNADLTGRLVAAYTAGLLSGEFYASVMEDLGTVDEASFLTELYSVSAEPGAAMLTVSVAEKSEADVRRFLTSIRAGIAGQYETIRTAIGEHDYEIMTESVYPTIDHELDAFQQENRLALSGYETMTDDASEALARWEKTSMPKMEYGAAYTAKRAVKAFIIGFVAGLVIMLCWLALRYVLSGRIRTVSDWTSYGIPVLGSVFRDPKRRAFCAIDRGIDRMFGFRRVRTTEQDCALTAHSLDAAIREQGRDGMQFVGLLDGELAERLMQTMCEAVPGTSFRYAGNVLADAVGSKKLQQSDAVMLLAENQTTRFKEIDQTLTLLRAWGKTVVGAVLIE